MNRTPRPVVGSARAARARAAALGKAYDEQKAAKALAVKNAARAAAIHAAAERAAKRPKRDAKGRFVKKATV